MLRTGFKSTMLLKKFLPKIAALNRKNNADDAPARKGNDNFFNTIPEQSPKAPPKRISFKASCASEDMMFVYLFTWSADGRLSKTLKLGGNFQYYIEFFFIRIGRYIY